MTSLLLSQADFLQSVSIIRAREIVATPLLLLGCSNGRSFILPVPLTRFRFVRQKALRIFQEERIEITTHLKQAITASQSWESVSKEESLLSFGTLGGAQK
jgi:hypothetical protein